VISFGSDICKALGLDPDRVMKLTLTIENPFMVGVEVKMVPTLDNGLSEVIERYRFEAKPLEESSD
jgi:hypothetical protein